MKQVKAVVDESVWVLVRDTMDNKVRPQVAGYVMEHVWHLAQPFISNRVCGFVLDLHYKRIQ